MNTQTANYECVRGHVTSVKVGGKVSVAIRCTCLREDGKVCKETAYYQSTNPSHREAAALDAITHIDYDWLDSLHDSDPYA